MTTARRTLDAYLTSEPVPEADLRAAVAVLSYALEELLDGVEQHIDEGSATVASWNRLTAYAYDANGLLDDQLAHYRPAAGALPAFLARRAHAREKTSEGTA